MSVREATLEHLYVVRMEGKIERADVDRIVRGAQLAARAVGRPVIYVGVSGLTFETPSVEVRDHIVARADDLLLHARSLEIVLEGDGIRGMMLRTVVRGMVTVGRTRRTGPRRAFIHSTVEEALDRVAGELSLATPALIARLTALGVHPGPQS